MRSLRMRLGVGLALFSAACGGDGSPSGPTPVATPITVTGPDEIRNGRSQAYTASANGCSWNTDAPGVVRINASTGEVTGQLVGSATIWCDAQGTRGTKVLRVIPDFQGTWVGQYVIETCQQTGTFVTASFCTAFAPNSQPPIALNWIQDGDRVSGAFLLGMAQGAGSGPISGGELIYIGQAPGSFTTDVGLRVRSDRVGEMTGAIEVVISGGGLSGFGSFRGSLRLPFVRSSSVSAAPAAVSGLGGASLDELERVMRSPQP